MKVLIVDDSFFKIDCLSDYINKHSPGSFIDTAESIANALQIIKDRALIYNLIIIDQYLPVRNGETPIADGGQKLLLEINRTLKTKIPNYIIGFSQFDNQDVEFSKVWKVIRFDIESKDWQLPFSELLNHIKNNNFNNENEIVQPTIFVEGLTDKFYIEQTIALYFPHLVDKVQIKTQSGAGSNWVINQLVAWSHSMFKNEKKEYIKCVGILDSDESGRKAKHELDSKSFSENHRKTFKCLFLQPKYNPLILDFYAKGCKVEMDIESLFDKNILKLADDNGYLENRNPMFMENPNDWQPYEKSIKQYISEKGFEGDQLLYLKKVKALKKGDFLKMINDENIKQNLTNFKPFVGDILKELGFDSITC